MVFYRGCACFSHASLEGEKIVGCIDELAKDANNSFFQEVPDIVSLYVALTGIVRICRGAGFRREKWRRFVQTSCETYLKNSVHA